MIVTYTAKRYDPAIAHRRYVRAVMGEPGNYRWCEVNPAQPNWDMRQGSVAGDELPDDVRAAADARLGWSPSYVEWPL
jgi:hypothetical protein